VATRLIILLLAAGAATAGKAASTTVEPVAYLPGKVTRVIDGDTIDVLLASGRIRVRLHGIDAPEGNQPGGAAASNWLRQQLRDRQVLLEPVSQDQYDRLVAVVHLEDRNINRELVQQGHAWAYRRYMRRVDRELCSLEDSARRQRAGLWAAAAAHAPWEHRSTGGKGPFADYGKATVEQCRKAIGKR
jgi:endonuclease YncB( thermonuclease family)